MSLWVTLGVTIENLEYFQIACEMNGIAFKKLPEKHAHRYQSEGLRIAQIVDKVGVGGRHGFGYLVIRDGIVRMEMDSDPNYNSIIKRLGKNGGKLGRDYTEMVVKEASQKAGGLILSSEVDDEGYLIMEIAS